MSPKTLVLEFFSWIFVVVVLRVESRSVSFNTEPANYTATEGDDAYFTCIGDFDSKDNPLMSIVWQRNNIMLSETNIEKNRIILQDTDNISILKLKGVHRLDSKYEYSCAIIENSRTLKQSPTVYLHINEVPSAHYPQCSIVTENIVEGKDATIRCLVEKIVPQPELLWFKDGVKVPSKNIINSDSIILEHTFRPKMSDNGNVLTCTLTTPAKDDLISNCSTRLLNVDYRPRVNVTGPSAIQVGEQALFVCFSQAQPPSNRITWYFDPPLDRNNYELESQNQVLRIKEVQPWNNGINLRCTAYNTVDATTSEILHIVTFDEQQEQLPNPNYPEQKKTGYKTSPDSAENMDSAMILSIAGCTLLLSTLVITMILCYHHICRIHRQTLNMAGEQIAQPQVYFEPKDMISRPLPDYTINHRYICRTVGIQVPSDGDIESVYTEIDEGKKKVISMKSISV